MFERMPLFPLTAHLLPDGLMKLRIFEPRYSRMIKESFHDETGFAMCMLKRRAGNSLLSMHPIGCRSKVVDFDSLEDGLLGVTVMGIERVRVANVRQEPDGLKVAEATPLPNWPGCPIASEQQLVANKLRQVLDTYPQLSELYPSPELTDGSWVCQRWLELLPMHAEDKQLLVEQTDCQATLAFLAEALSSQAILDPNGK